MLSISFNNSAVLIIFALFIVGVTTAVDEYCAVFFLWSKVNIKVRGITALHAAAHQGHQQTVTVLLSAGAKIELTDDDGDTAIHFAANGWITAINASLLGWFIYFQWCDVYL